MYTALSGGSGFKELWGYYFQFKHADWATQAIVYLLKHITLLLYREVPRYSDPRLRNCAAPCGDSFEKHGLSKLPEFAFCCIGSRKHLENWYWPPERPGSTVEWHLALVGSDFVVVRALPPACSGTNLKVLKRWKAWPVGFHMAGKNLPFHLQ